MRVTSIMATVATALMAASSALAIPCNVDVKARSTHAKRINTGRTFTVSAKVTNTGSSTLNNIYVQLTLPDYLVPVKGSVSKFAHTDSSEPVLSGEFVWFRSLSLPAKKAIRIKAAVGVQACQPAGDVQIEGIAYQLDTNGGVLCSTMFNPPTINVVRSSKTTNKKLAKWDEEDCVTPTPAPSSVFDLQATSQRCLEAVPLARRRLTAEKGKNEHRELVPGGMTSNQCFQACADFLSTTTPYYFNLSPTSDCYCCKTCFPIYDPNWKIYQANQNPTSPPTPAPTPAPSPAPTPAPTPSNFD